MLKPPTTKRSQRNIPHVKCTRLEKLGTLTTPVVKLQAEIRDTDDLSGTFAGAISMEMVHDVCTFGKYTPSSLPLSS